MATPDVVVATLDVEAMISILDVMEIKSTVDEAVNMFITGVTTTLDVVLRFISIPDEIGIRTVDVLGDMLRVGVLVIFIVKIGVIVDIAVILIFDVVPTLINHKSFVQIHVHMHAFLIQENHESGYYMYALHVSIK